MPDQRLEEIEPGMSYRVRPLVGYSLEASGSALDLI
jgi:hypothetical protein